MNYFFDYLIDSLLKISNVETLFLLVIAILITNPFNKAGRNFYAFVNDISADIFDNKVNADSLCGLAYFLFFVIGYNICPPTTFTTKFFFAFIFPFWLALVFFLFCTFTTAVYMLFYDFLSLGIFCFDSSRSKYKTDIPNKNRKEIEKNDKDNEIPRY